MKRLAIIGAGDLGLQIAHFAKTDGHYDEIYFLDDYNTGRFKEDIEILGKTSDAFRLYKDGVFDEVLLGIGYRHLSRKKELFEELDGVIPFGKIIHSTCLVDPTAKILEGCVIYPGCVLDARVVISKNCLLNLSCTISHDSLIGPHSFLSPRVTLAGFVKIGSKCNIGIGTIIIDNLKVSDDIQTGGGTVVTKNLESSGLYVGNPARFVR